MPRHQSAYTNSDPQRDIAPAPRLRVRYRQLADLIDRIAAETDADSRRLLAGQLEEQVAATTELAIDAALTQALEHIDTRLKAITERIDRQDTTR